jgi:hypothetical protein
MQQLGGMQPAGNQETISETHQLWEEEQVYEPLAFFMFKKAALK